MNKTLRFSLVSLLMMLCGTVFADYVKVTATSDITDGEYLIVYESGNVAFNGALETLDAVSNTVAVEIADGTIASSADVDAAVFTIDTENGTVKSASGKYIGISSNSNGLKTAEDAATYTHTFSIDDNGNAIITAAFSGSTMTLRYNKASGQTRFRYYKSGQQDVQLYKKATDTGDTREATTIELGEYVAEGTVGGTMTLPTATVKAGDAIVEGAAVAWSSSNESVATIDGNTVNFVGAGTATIKAAYAGDETNYKASTASFTLTVMAAPYTSLAALQADVTSTSTPVTVVFNNVFVTAVKGSNAYLADADGYGVLLYKSNHGLQASQVLNGTASAKLVLYRGQTELTDLDIDALTVSEGELAPTEKTIDQITTANQSTLVTLKNVTYADGKLTDGTNEIKYYDNFGVETTLEEGKAYNVTGIVILYNTTLEIAPRTADDVVEYTEVVEDHSYKFVAAEWIAGDAGRISPSNVTVDEAANTITVDQTGTNNVALLFRSSNVYEVTAQQRYFVIKATGLSTADDASYLWWLNNTNNGSQIKPTDIYDEEGQTVFAWDCATIAIGGQLGLQDTEFKDEGGWSTTFGMTLADNNVPAVISYIGFQEAVENPVQEFEYSFVANEWPAGDPSRISAANVTVDEAANTITVNATGDNNVALNFKTDKMYYVTKPVKFFVIQATGLSTAEGKSKLWWLNAKNNGGEMQPTFVKTGDDGITSFLWDVTADATFATGFSTTGKTYLDGTGAGTWGWTTTFGMTLADNSVPAVISYIGYEAEDSELVTAIKSVSNSLPTTGNVIYNMAGQRVQNAQKGLYIINGKKVMK